MTAPVNRVQPGGPWALAIAWARMQVEYDHIGADNLRRQLVPDAIGYDRARRIDPRRRYEQYHYPWLRWAGYTWRDL